MHLQKKRVVPTVNNEFHKWLQINHGDICTNVAKTIRSKRHNYSTTGVDMTDSVKDVIEDGSRVRSEGEHRISRQPELHEALQVCPTELIYLPDQITLSSKKVLGKGIHAVT